MRYWMHRFCWHAERIYSKIFMVRIENKWLNEHSHRQKVVISDKNQKDAVTVNRHWLGTSAMLWCDCSFIICTVTGSNVVHFQYNFLPEISSFFQTFQHNSRIPHRCRILWSFEWVREGIFLQFFAFCLIESARKKSELNASTYSCSFGLHSWRIRSLYRSCESGPSRELLF